VRGPDDRFEGCMAIAPGHLQRPRGAEERLLASLSNNGMLGFLAAGPLDVRSAAT
jgi:hypothetical protein